MNDLDLIKKYIPIDKQKESIEKLNTGYPVQYIIGNVEFYGNIINVNENVLIPRFETEYLVDKTIKYLEKLNISNPDILEIGTGSGCIAIALKKELSCNIDAIDISSLALEVAKDNAKLNNVTINFIESDINNFKSNKKYDLIISNPPYVPYDGTYDEKIKYEPERAIFAKNNGIYYYDIILKIIANNLKDKYLISFEIGDKEGSLIKDLVNKYLKNANVYIEKDYNNYERYIFISNLVLE
jgi:release factor glutamine methyltransferase